MNNDILIKYWDAELEWCYDGDESVPDCIYGVYVGYEHKACFASSDLDEAISYAKILPNNELLKISIAERCKFIDSKGGWLFSGGFEVWNHSNTHGDWDYRNEDHSHDFDNYDYDDEECDDLPDHEIYKVFFEDRDSDCQFEDEEFIEAFEFAKENLNKNPIICRCYGYGNADSKMDIWWYKDNKEYFWNQSQLNAHTISPDPLTNWFLNRCGCKTLALDNTNDFGIDVSDMF